MDYWDVKSLVIEALSDIRWGFLGISPGHLKLRRITEKGNSAWTVGLWFKSYGPDIEIRHTDVRSRQWIREFLVKCIEEKVPDWVKIVDSRS